MCSQEWSCRQCQKAGSVEFDKNASIESVMAMIGKSHKELSPACEQPTHLLLPQNQ